MLTAEVAARGGFSLVETAFLDCATPDLGHAVANLVRQGAKRIVVVPFFLTLGIHMRRDLPAITADLRQTHSGVEIEIAQPLEGHPALADIVLARAEETIHGGSRSAGEAR
jgi:sirohydrochlorin ferrochelatase